MASIGSLFTKKVIMGLGVIVTLFTIVGGIWGFDSHYATDKRVDNVEASAKNEIKDLEITIAGALQNQQYKSDVRYFQFMYDKLTDDLYKLRKLLEREPDNEILKQDYNDTKERRKDVKNKIDESMQKIKVN